MNRLISNNEALKQKLCALNNIREQILVENGQKEIFACEAIWDIILQCWEKEGLRRIVVGIGDFPASGKTTGAKSIIRSINDFSHTNLAAHLPMDGFHFSNKKLLAEGLDEIKGHVTTYDVSSYVKRIQ